MDVFHAEHGSAEEELFLCALLLIVGTSICAFIWQKTTKRTSMAWYDAKVATKPRTSTPKGARKSSRVKTPRPIDEAFPRIGAIKREMLAMSPIREVAGLFSTRPCTMADYTAPVLVSKQTQALSASAKTRGNLALSDILLTVDIPPTAPKQVDGFEDAISQLCEMLERW